MPAYLERMPAGIPGEISRPGNSTLESNLVGADPIRFGSVVKLVDGFVASIGGGDTNNLIYGFLVRSYPTTGVDGMFGPGEAPAGTLQSVMRRGYMSVTLKGATAAAKQGAAYVRVTAAAGKAVGDIEAAAGDGLVAIPNCIFMGDADTGGITEISYNI
jgi:hypothetical protein